MTTGSHGPTSSEWLVLLASTPWHGAALSDQRLAAALARRGPVAYVDPPRAVYSRRNGLAWPPRLLRAPAEQVAPQLLVVAPRVLPASRRPGGRVLAARLYRRAVRRALRELDGGVAAVLTTRLDAAVARGYGERRSVYWAKDDYRAGAHLVGNSPVRVAAAERRLAGVVDRVVAVSPEVARKWEGLGVAADVAPAGCELARFAAAATTRPAADVRLRAPVAAFVGHISDRVDFALLDAVADCGVALLLVGAHQHTFSRHDAWRRLLARPEVQWVGGRPPGDLPAYLAAARVGLLPYAPTDFNRASAPLKLYEYLAAGRPVVSTDLPAARALAGPDVVVAATPEQFAAAVVEMAGRPLDAAAVTRRQQRVRGHDWEVVAERYRAVLAASAGSEPDAADASARRCS